ncbi:hypothetical protein EON66_08155 [archaeon]|nr:MAG: hypothetical protein EON66_08155 [archaeon]
MQTPASCAPCAAALLTTPLLCTAGYTHTWHAGRIFVNHNVKMVQKKVKKTTESINSKLALVIKSGTYFLTSRRVTAPARAQKSV